MTLAVIAAACFAVALVLYAYGAWRYCRTMGRVQVGLLDVAERLGGISEELDAMAEGGRE